jgi:hypothetical protein
VSYRQSATSKNARKRRRHPATTANRTRLVRSSG